MSWNIIEWQGTRDQQRILGITPHFLPVLSSCSSTLFFLYFILELFVTSLPTSALTPSPNSRPQIILGWPKSSFRFFHTILRKKSHELFGQPNSYRFFSMYYRPGTKSCHYADPHNTPARQVYYLHSASTESRLDCAGKLAQISQLVGKGGKTQAASFSSSSLPFSEA